MAYPKQNYFHRRRSHHHRGPRANNRIHAREVQVIDSDGKNMGVVPTQEAIALAKDQGLDLIEISPKANPPVCKIIDMGKYRYGLQKKASKAKKKQKIVNLKEIKLRPGTKIHDYNFKIRNALKFLEKGDKVKFTVKFKGREMQHQQLGADLMLRIKNDITKVGKVEADSRLEGRQMVMIIQPL